MVNQSNRMVSQLDLILDRDIDTLQYGDRALGQKRSRYNIWFLNAVNKWSYSNRERE